MAGDAAAAPQLSQLSGPLGCISEDGAGGRCAIGPGLAGVTGVVAAPGRTPGTTRLYATSPSHGTLTVLEADPVAGGMVHLQCLSARPRAGCVTARALAGAIDVTLGWQGRYVYVAARDDDAVAIFERTNAGLRQLPGESGCVAVAIPGCTPAPLLDEPVSIATMLPFVYVAARRSDAVVGFSLDYDDGRMVPEGCVQNGDGAANGCSSARGLESPEDLAATRLLYLFVAASGSDGVVALMFGDTQPGGARGCANETGSQGCAQVNGLRGASRVAAVERQGIFDVYNHVYAAAPGSANLETMRHDDWGFSHRGALPLAPSGALALPPAPQLWDDENAFDGGSHLYAGADELLAFRRLDGHSGELSARGASPHFPDGRVEGVAVSWEPDARALYAAVPSAGALLAFARNRSPDGAESTGKRVELDVAGGATKPKIRILDGKVGMDRRGRVGIRVRCATTESPCRARLTLRGNRPLAHRSATLRSGVTRRLRAQLPRGTRRAIRRAHKGLRLTVAATGLDAQGRTGRAMRRVRVRARRAP